MKASEVANLIKPFVLRWIEQAQAQARGGAPSPHDLASSHHTGSLADSQAPQFLKLDGSRPLLGSLTVADGATIDGVDLSAHANDPAAHHTPFVGLLDGFGTPIDAQSEYVTVTSNNPHITTTSDVGALLIALDNTHNPGAASRLLSTDATGKIQLTGLTLTGDLAINGGKLTSTGDLVLDLSGKDALPNTSYDLNLGSIQKRWLSVHAAELRVAQLVAQEEIGTVGGRWYVGSTNILTADLSASSTTLQCKYNDVQSGDLIRFERSGNVEWMKITSAPGGSGPYTYAIQRNLDGSGANAWSTGDSFVDTGNGAGAGWLDAYAAQGMRGGIGPTLTAQVRNSATYNDWAEHAALGNLNGLYGYSTDTWGMGVGKYSPTTTNLTADATNGIRIRRGNTQLAQWDTSGNIKLGPTNALQLNADGSASFAGSITFGNGTHVGDASGLNVYAAGTTNIYRAYDNSGLGGGMIVRDTMIMPGTVAGTIRRIMETNTGGNSSSGVYSRAEFQLSAGRGSTTDSYLLLGTQGVGATLMSTERLSLASYNRTGYIHVPLPTPATSANWSGTNKAIIGWTTINLASEFGIPVQVRGVFVRLVGTATATGALDLSLSGNAANAAVSLRAYSTTLPDDESGFVPSSDGTIAYIVRGTAFNGVTLIITGYLI